LCYYFQPFALFFLPHFFSTNPFAEKKMPYYIAMELSVSYLNNVDRETPMKKISAALNKMERHSIQKIPWPEFSYKPTVTFSIAYAQDCILLKYFVQEKAIRIENHVDNSPVHEDSCVEFFISFDNNEEYYNLEFNCEGTCLLGFGKSISQRKLISKEVIRKIRRQSIVQSVMDGESGSVTWELTLVIPLPTFIYHQISHLKGQYCRVNFYKCGDKLPEPHFLAWNDIAAGSPNFHLPEFFGRMYFL
jgi:hypothetical protein